MFTLVVTLKLKLTQIEEEGKKTLRFVPQARLSEERENKIGSPAPTSMFKLNFFLYNHINQRRESLQ